jgi:hypothetical protein
MQKGRVSPALFVCTGCTETPAQIDGTLLHKKATRSCTHLACDETALICDIHLSCLIAACFGDPYRTRRNVSASFFYE